MGAGHKAEKVVVQDQVDDILNKEGVASARHTVTEDSEGVV